MRTKNNSAGIVTSRTNEKARITIDYEKCNVCGLCVGVCADSSLKISEGRVIESPEANVWANGKRAFFWQAREFIQRS
jgi:formate hydrogenlyase subunit 6/NADH:ubiquinone oxidoreductase subunit I